MARDSLDRLGDEDLLVLFAHGDPEAAGLLMGRLAPGILRYASRVLADRSEAEDVTQETMLRLWRAAPGWRRGEAQPRTWAYRVATNLCTDRLRARRRGGMLPIDAVAEPADPGRTALAGMVEADRMQALGAALERLPERQRQAVVLRHIEGLTNPEIAEILAVGVEAVESLTARGKRALQAILTGQKPGIGYEDEGE